MATRPAPDGSLPAKPIILGSPNGDKPIHVRATGLIGPIFKNDEVWVTGTGVRRAVERGSLIILEGHLPAKESPAAPPTASGDPATSQEPVPQPGSEPAGVVVIAYDPGDHNVEDVIEYLAANPEQTDSVLAAERAGKARKGILEA